MRIESDRDCGKCEECLKKQKLEQFVTVRVNDTGNMARLLDKLLAI